MLENGHRGGCQWVRVKFEVEDKRCAERNEQRGRRRNGEIETGSVSKTSCAHLR
jgi:hypothetical protein